jgi:hypothetical protein
VVRDVDIATERDGIDLVSSRHVLFERLSIHSSDDALALKSDYALGAILDSHDIAVRHCVLQSDTCNALQVGSETVGDFDRAIFSNISILGAGKAGIGIVTMDGARVNDFLYEDISMQGVSNAVFMYIGARANQRRPLPVDASAPMDDYVGSITNVTIQNVRATDVVGSHGNFTLTLDGQPTATFEADGVEVERVHDVGPGISVQFANYTVKGRGLAEDVALNPPHSPTDYTPRSLGVRPSFALFLRRCVGVTFGELFVDWEAKDGRPAVVLDQAGTGALPVVLASSKVPRDRTVVAFDVGLRNGSVFYQQGSTNVAVAVID